MQFKEGQKLALSCTASIALGWLLPYLQTYGMPLITRISPVPDLLKSTGLDGAAFTWAMYPFDFLCHVAFSLPIALILTLLQPRKLWLYTLIAVVPFFVALNVVLLRNDTLVLSNALVQQWITSLVALPVAVMIARWAVGWGRPNSSFKPKPLRGSA